MGLKNRIYREAISIALQKHFPERIPLSLPQAATNDFYSVELLEPDTGRRSALVTGYSGDNYEGQYYNEPTGSGAKASIIKRVVHEYGFKYRHYFRGYEFGGTSPLMFIIGHYTRYHRILITLDTFAQRRFNKRPLARRHRIEVLRMFVDKTTEDLRYAVSHVTVVEQLYSLRSFAHPQRDVTLNYYNLLLRSLRSDGHLDYEDHTYRLNGAGMAALDRYVMEEKRHNQSIRQQIVLSVLTFALILVGIGQAYITWTAPS
ncbi:hypothetical protein [Allorhizobium taibaishanense]|uniref:Uncharacterized protein n=1 Tax=Allorhizobium taibaishanense TaxID=887144 RepID=A0A7W6HM57_9HYPH|nr:hypothetical protein [Allorhizobium taibaishanense]MBB4007528.1 hypothetical protein [Allorhizobium taibaishanense]